MKGELWYNHVSIPSEEKALYVFVIINQDTRTISSVTSNIERYFGDFGTLDESDRLDGKVDDFNYRIYMFYSTKSFDKDQIFELFKGRNRKDKNLYERVKPGFEGIEGIEGYVKGAIERNL